jgi:uncharacterized protein
MKNEVFSIPIEKNRNIILFPIKGKMFWANEKISLQIIEGKEILDKSLNNQISEIQNYKDLILFNKALDIDKYNQAIFILSNSCNLACSYCFAKEAHNKGTMSMDKIVKIVDFIVDNTKSIAIFSFIGGGEPTINWEIFQKTINYIQKRCKESQIKPDFRLTTNGTLLDFQKISFLKEKKISVSVSFDILPDIQNQQRKTANKNLDSFKLVDNCLKILSENEINYNLRTTITWDNVYRLQEMIDFVNINYKAVKRMNVEPQSGGDDFVKLFEVFVDEFLKGLKYARKKDISLSCSYSKNMKQPRVRFCRSEFCITPDLDIVSCHRASSPDDQLFKKFQYGNLKNNSFYLDDNKHRRISEESVFSFSDCDDCFAKYYCAGNCTFIRNTISNDEQSLICNQIKKLYKELFLIKLSNN